MCVDYPGSRIIHTNAPDGPDTHARGDRNRLLPPRCARWAAAPALRSELPTTEHSLLVALARVVLRAVIDDLTRRRIGGVQNLGACG